MHTRVLTLAGLLALGACVTPEPAEPPPAPPIDVAWEPVLTDLAVESLGMVPAWLRDDLAIAMQGLSEDLQNEYALLIVDEDEPWLVDEIAFTIAHLSPEVLESANFHPELITLNAELVYARDEVLDYVELVEVGGSDTDPERYTTTRYRVGQYDETTDETSVVEQELGRDDYYWYVVHPRGEDERPYFINPDAYGSQPRAPDDGYFWRDFLWWAASDDCPDGVGECPVLEDMLTGVDLLWERRYGNSTDNGAMGQIIQWVNGVMHFGALEERSVQPVRIYGLHHGNCGEHGDLTNAAVRIGLIPGIVIEARGNDHCWSEFGDAGWTDSGWVQVEPVNNSIDYYGYYADADGNYNRSRNGIDDDCDGLADDADRDTDADEDGYTIADGDCHDGKPEVFPGAEEIANSFDDNCDGVADEGLDPEDIDADGDGWTVPGGDCDDTRAETNPDALDPLPSSNRLFGLSGGRGDALVLNRTADYVKTFELVVYVEDAEGRPVDGALVWVLGWSTTYSSATGWWPVTEMVSDATGTARMDLGYANEYAIRVDSNVGSWPPGSDTSIRPIIDTWPEEGEVFEYTVTLEEADQPAGARVESVVDLGGATPDYRLDVSHTTGGYRVAQVSRLLHDTFSLAFDGGEVDLFVVDQWGYERFVEGRDFAALGFVEAAAESDTSLQISDDREWYVVVANTRLGATTVIGDLQMELSALGEVPFDAPVALDRHFRLGPDEHVAFHIGRPAAD
ncbi:MAG: hypothetical protein GY898_16135 [Proteobacteria bacterium]|nr:hypothetical protein [Pseudomonadota bacterium]